jgi:hypothetical protein
MTAWAAESVNGLSRLLAGLARWRDPLQVHASDAPRFAGFRANHGGGDQSANDRIDDRQLAGIESASADAHPIAD